MRSGGTEGSVSRIDGACNWAFLSVGLPRLVAEVQREAGRGKKWMQWPAARPPACTGPPRPKKVGGPRGFELGTPP